MDPKCFKLRGCLAILGECCAGPYPEPMATGRGYERKGDPFTLKVQRGEGPPCVRRWRKTSTGREYFTRVMVSDCYRIDARLIGQAIREHAQRLAALSGEAVDALKLAQGLAFDWHPEAGKMSVRAAQQPKELRAEVRVKVEATETGSAQARGVRYWLTCPRCSRRCGVLYASRWGRDGSRVPDLLTGCRDCLGLTDESRQRHKCLDWASARLGQRPYKGGRRPWYEGRSVYSHARAHRVFMASFGRAFKGLGIPMPGSED